MLSGYMVTIEWPNLTYQGTTIRKEIKCFKFCTRKPVIRSRWVDLITQKLKSIKGWDVLNVLEMPTGLEKLYSRLVRYIQILQRRNPELY